MGRNNRELAEWEKDLAERQWVLVLRDTTSGPYYVQEHEVAQIDANGNFCSLETANFQTYDLRSFVIRAQGDDARPDDGIYGYRAGYQYVDVHDVERAQSILRVMKRVHDGLEQLREEDGNVRSFGQYCLRVCKLLGITRMVIRSKTDYDHYTVLSLSEGMEYIDYLVMQWQERCRVAKAS